MKNCMTCFLGQLEECPAIIKKFNEKKCFAWCKDEKEWEKRVTAALDYKDIMETRVQNKKKLTKAEKIQRIKQTRKEN